MKVTGATLDRILVVLLSICVIYLHSTSSPDSSGACAPAPCPKCDKICPVCICRNQQAKVEKRALCRNASLPYLLSEVSTLPKGIITNTNPAVYVATQYPALTYLQLQQDMHTYDLLRAIALRIGKITNQRVMDVGSSYCTFVMFAAQVGFRTLAVEPDANVHGSIETSISINGLSDRVNIERRYIFEASTNVKTPQGKPLPTVTLTQLLDDEYTLVRIDAHGVELLILRSGLEAFRNRKVENIIVMFTVPDPQVQSKMKPNGPNTVTKMLRMGYKARLLPGFCQAKLSEHLAVDSSLKVSHGVEAYKIQEADVPTLFQSLSNMEGNNCPVWFFL